MVKSFWSRRITIGAVFIMLLLNGYEGSTDPYDPSMIWNRSSINCTIALYDSDKDVLYIYKMDT